MSAAPIFLDTAVHQPGPQRPAAYGVSDATALVLKPAAASPFPIESEAFNDRETAAGSFAASRPGCDFVLDDDGRPVCSAGLRRGVLISFGIEVAVIIIVLLGWRLL